MSWKTKEGGRDWEWGWSRDCDRNRSKEEIGVSIGAEREREAEARAETKTGTKADVETKREPGAKIDTESEAKARGRQLSSSASPLNTSLPTSPLPSPYSALIEIQRIPAVSHKMHHKQVGKLHKKRRQHEDKSKTNSAYAFMNEIRKRERVISIQSMATFLTKLLAFSFGALNAVAKWRKVR